MATYVADKSGRVLHRIDLLVADCAFATIPNDDKEVVFTDVSAAVWLHDLGYKACPHCLADPPHPEGALTLKREVRS